MAYYNSCYCFLLSFYMYIVGKAPHKCMEPGRGALVKRLVIWSVQSQICRGLEHVWICESLSPTLIQMRFYTPKDDTGLNLHFFFQPWASVMKKVFEINGSWEEVLFFHLLCCLVVGDAVMVRREYAAADGTVDKDKSNRLLYNRTHFFYRYPLVKSYVTSLPLRS